MLPFLKPKAPPSTGIATAVRASDYSEKDDADQGLRACAFDLMSAFHNKDVEGAMAALKAAFIIMESQPHPEGEHTESE